jgi:long-chain fatty acid transport protein
MRSTLQRSLLSLCVTGALCASGAAYATNGYFSHGYGVKDKGIAGSSTAFAQDSIIIATNPAGISKLGSRLDVGINWFHPEREYTAGPITRAPNPNEFPLGPGKVESDSEDFFIPELGYIGKINQQWSWGIAAFGNGGLNTDYPNDAPCAQPGGRGTFCDGNAGVDLAQLFIAPTIAYSFAGGKWSVGLSPVIGYQRFKATGLRTFGAFGLSNDPTALSNNGYDDAFGWGARIGVMGEVANGFSIGASVQSKIYFDEFDDYAGLFAEEGDFDAPPTANAGVAWSFKPGHTLTLDYRYIWYEEVAAVSNKFDNINQCQAGDRRFCLGGDDGIGFGWDNTWDISAGYTLEGGNNWTYRVGYSYGNDPIGSSEVLFNILAPAVMKHHFTAGLTKAWGTNANNEINVHGMYSPEEKEDGPNPFGGQDLEIKMWQFELGVSYSRLF